VPQADGWRKIDVTLVPADQAGNLLGPGRSTKVECLPKDSCRVEPTPVDASKGTYKIALTVAPDVASVRVNAFDAVFNVATACPNCPKLTAVKVDPTAVLNNQPANGTVTLSGPAPQTPAGGAVVFLASDLRSVASVPESVLVPAGKSTVTFPITVYHVHDQPETVVITAAYGGETQQGNLTVSDRPGEKAPPAGVHHQHDD
jgi:hypothetical protein